MTFTPLGGFIGSGIPALPTPVGGAATVMGTLVFGLLVLAAVVIIVRATRQGRRAVLPDRASLARAERLS